MNAARLLVLAALLGFASQAAVAFQETNSGSQAAQSATPSAHLGVPATAPKSSGTEIKVPGLGTIGALPKLDFGLELLYGASGQPQQQLGPLDDKIESGAQIRGTLKYRFPN